MRLHSFDVAGITISDGNVTVDGLHACRANKHYNVTVEKVSDEYIITAERPDIEFYFDDCYDRSEIDKVVPKDVSHTKPLLFGLIKGGTPYLIGPCELKERTKRVYRTNKIVVISD